MNRAKHLEIYAKRRDAEEQKIEKTNAVNKYFDKWGQITSRYQQWTAPEYYEQAAANFRHSEEIKTNNANLESRRMKLQELFKMEEDHHAEQLKQLKMPASKQIPNEMLQNIHENFKRTEEERRRLELESRLYKQWRSGSQAESVIIDSKSDNQALAKMNWMDKQIAAQVERDRQKQHSEERQLRIQEETRKHEELMLHQRMLFDDELKTLKDFQQNHITELKENDQIGEELRNEESHLQQRQEELTQELNQLEANSQQREQRAMFNTYNTNRVKMQLKHRSTTIRQDLREDIEMLNRLAVANSTVTDQLELIREQFEMKYDSELQKQQHIDGMFESEAKNWLQEANQTWITDAKSREKLLRQMICSQKKWCGDRIEVNLQRQHELLHIKENHLKAIEQSNCRFQEISMEQQRDARKPFNNIEANIELPHEESNSSKIADQSHFHPSKFAKKKVAWT